MGKKQVGKFTFPSGNQTEKISEAFKLLGLHAAATTFEFLIQKVHEDHGTMYDLLEQLLEAEFIQKEEDRVNLRVQQAKLEPLLTLQDFDTKHNRSVKLEQIKELASCRFMSEGKNVFLLGPPGVGKTFIATAIGYEAILKGHSVRCMRVNEFITAVNRAADSSTSRLFSALTSPELLILDDIDFYDTDDNTGNILFTVLKYRSDHLLSTIITSNKHPKQWAKQFGSDPQRAGALVDRLLNHRYLIPISIKGDSYRVPNLNSIPALDTAGEPEKMSWSKKPIQSVLSHIKS